MKLYISGWLIFGGLAGVAAVVLFGLSWVIYGLGPLPDWIVYPIPPLLLCVSIGFALAIADDIAKWGAP